MRANRVDAANRREPPRIAIVEQLRGLAALAVVWFHFTNGNPRFLADGPLKSSGTYGWVGVEVFFVISAFIIPFTMYQRRYTVSENYGRFLGKRLLRLEPPYLACVVLTVVLGYVSSVMPAFRGVAPDYDSLQLLLHIGYLVGFSEYDWTNPVFWSLAIEFQFYLMVGLLFPLIASPQPRVRCLTLLGLAASALFPVSDSFLPHHLLIFVLGILTFHLRVGQIAATPYMLVSLAVAGAISVVNQPAIAIAAVLTAFSIAFVRAPDLKPLLWLGTISYSLYLIHVPLGGRIINLGERLNSRVPVFYLAIALAISVAAAMLWYRWLERPSKNWSSAVGYRPRVSNEVERSAEAAT